MFGKRIATTAALGLCIASSAALGEQYKFTDADRAIVAALRAPNEVFAAKLKGPPRVIDGQRLHPKLQARIEEVAAIDAAGGETPEQEIAHSRAKLVDPAKRPMFRAWFERNWPLRTAVSSALEIKDVQIPGVGGAISARIYTPVVKERHPLPVLLYMHGGGWVMSSVNAVDPAVRLLANEAKVIVVSIDYRLAPEHPFPAAHQDASSAFDWLEDHAREIGGDPERIGIGGDSAGANMAAWVSQKRLEAGLPGAKAQLLYYPALDLDLSHQDKYPSFQMFGEGYLSDKWFTTMARGLTFANASESDAASPLLAKSFRNLPSSIVVTAGFDMLRDQGREYSRRLVSDGVDVVYRNYPSLVHGFMQYSGTVDDANLACVETARMFGEMIRGTHLYAPGGKK
jgi:acetyl esterase